MMKKFLSYILLFESLVIVILGIACFNCFTVQKKSEIEKAKVLYNDFISDEINMNGYFIRFTAQKRASLKKVEMLYSDFISGKINFNSYNLEDMATPAGEPEKRYHTDYVIIDSNEDGIPELHIRNGREFRVFSYKEGEIVNIYLGSFYPTQYTLRNDGTFLYRDYNTTLYVVRSDYYRVFQVDKDGNEQIEAEFYWCDLNENAVYDEDDQYFFDEEECTETEWIKRTSKYIYINNETNAPKDTDILDEVEWIVYCEAV